MARFQLEGPTPPRGGPGKPRPIIVVDPDLHLLAEEGPAPVARRVNIKAMVALIVVVVLVPIAVFTLANSQEARLRRQAFEQASEAAKKGQVDRALTGLGHYLERWPEDVPALELMARLRTDGARTLDEVLAAADAQDLLIRVDPMGPGRQENRRKLVDLYIRWSDGIRLGSSHLKLSLDKMDGRARAAVNIARQRLAFGSDDAESHRVLTMALECLAASGDVEVMAESTVEYEKAFRRDPTDATSAERLAQIIYERGKETAIPDEILDDLLKAAPNSVEARMARFRFFSKTDRFDKAKIEIDKATTLAPTDVAVRTTAAVEALLRRDPATARRHIEALSAAAKVDPSIPMFSGFIELAEQRPEVAVEVWHKGLLASSGTDRDLT